MRASEAMVHLDRRRQRLVAEARRTEDQCGELGLQLERLRQYRGEQALELAGLDRALDALRRDADTGVA